MSGEAAAHWRDLFTEVVSTHLCSGCGACVVACPRKVLD
jgi:NAD-dependent dihydropyrimidine dehydrogenase PreA subunit